MRKISIIITTKNEGLVIDNLLESIADQSLKAYEVLVVDNYSSDDTLKIAKSYKARVYTKGPERSSQRNYGVKMAKGNYVLILDADMTLTPNIIKELSRSSKQIVTVPEKSFGVGPFVKFKVFEREFYEGEDSVEAPRFFAKKLFEKYGGYDEKITGPEDYDLPLRMKKDGYKFGRIKSYILHNEKYFNPIKSAKKKFYYASKASLYAKRHKDMILKQGNFIFRPVFFRKWKKLVSSPFLSIGMLMLKIIEGTGALMGFIYGQFKK